MKNKIIYIAGPMTYYEDYNRPAFHTAEKKLKEKYPHAVILNPACLPNGLEHEQYMKLCLPMVEVADTFYLLKGWIRSKGANIELERALVLKKTIETEET